MPVPNEWTRRSLKSEEMKPTSHCRGLSNQLGLSHSARKQPWRTPSSTIDLKGSCAVSPERSITDSQEMNDRRLGRIGTEDRQTGFLENRVKDTLSFLNEIDDKRWRFVN